MWITGESLRAVACLFGISPLIESLFVELNEGDFQKVQFRKHREKIGIEGCYRQQCCLTSSLLRLKVFKDVMMNSRLLKNAMVLEELVVFSCKQNSSSGNLVRHLRKFYINIQTLPRTSSSGFFLF